MNATEFFISKTVLFPRILLPSKKYPATRHDISLYVDGLLRCTFKKLIIDDLKNLHGILGKLIADEEKGGES